MSYKKIIGILSLFLGSALYTMEPEVLPKNDKRVLKAQQELIALIKNCAKKEQKMNEDVVLEKLKSIASFSVNFDILVDVQKSRTCHDSYSLLHVAVRRGFARVVDFALSYGARPTMGDRLELTPLHIAASNGMHAIVLRLLEAGADITACALQRRSVMHCAAAGGDYEIIKILYNFYLERYGKEAADDFINACDESGNTPLHYLLTAMNQLKNQPSEYNARHLGIMGLIESDADLNSANIHGATPLHMAVHYGILSVVPLFLQRGADINSVEETGMTALHLAMYLPGRYEFIPLLLDAGADENALNTRQLTPLQVAENKGNEEAIKAYQNWIAANQARKKREEHAQRDKLAQERAQRLREIREPSRAHLLGIQARLRNFLRQGNLIRSTLNFVTPK